MSEATLLWLFGILITLQTTAISALVAAVWSHLNDCRDFRTTIATGLGEVKSQLDRVDRDIGTHETGLRGQVHQLTSDITPLALWAQTEQEYQKQRRHRREDRDDKDRD